MGFARILVPRLDVHLVSIPSLLLQDGEDFFNLRLGRARSDGDFDGCDRAGIVVVVTAVSYTHLYPTLTAKTKTRLGWGTQILKMEKVEG